MAHSEGRPAPRQFAYILRLWETRSVPPDLPVTWCASLENIHSGQSVGFPNVEALVAFLRSLQRAENAESAAMTQGTTSG